jgi:hypothetical protein
VYRLDGHLVGISVIDVLPRCVSSVYFIWDPDWAWASLGKLSALREVAMAREMAEAGADGMGWLYMGERDDLPVLSAVFVRAFAGKRRGLEVGGWRSG